MRDLSGLLDAAASGDRRAAADLLPLVYDELRRIAAAKMAQEKPGHTLDATGLVHETYLRLLGGQQFDGRNHFFKVAAVAMRRILVDHARARNAQKRGGDVERVDVAIERLVQPELDSQLEAIDEALNRLAQFQPQIAELVELRYFVGLTIPAVATILGVSPRTADAWWAYARGWLAEELTKS